MGALCGATIALAGCGGGGGGGAAPAGVGGVAQKGPFLAGAAVAAHQLNASGARAGGSVTGTAGTNGAFDLQATWSGLTEVEVSGTAFDENTGAPHAASFTLRALVQVTEGADLAANVNLFTHFAAARIRTLLAAGNDLATALATTDTELEALFDLQLRGAGPEALDLGQGAGLGAEANANLLLFSAALLRAGHAQAQIDALAADFADNGQIDGAALGPFARLRLAAAQVDLGATRARMHTLPGILDAPDFADLGNRFPAWVRAGVGGGLLNDTGILSCANDNTEGLACNSAGDGTGLGAGGGTATHPGQDAEFGRDLSHNDPTDGRGGFQFTKLDAAGNPLADQGQSFAANPWSCVRDEVTGLVWEVKTDDNGLRDKDNSYTWFNPDPNTNGGGVGVQDGGNCTGGIDCDTLAYAAAVNAQGLCGFADWRLPGVEELRSIVDYGVPSPGPVVDTAFFANATNGFYWSASPFAGFPGNAWNVSFSFGIDGNGFKAVSNQVRLVRGGQ